MVKETPSRIASDSDSAGDEPSSRRPIRKAAAKAHLAWEQEKRGRNRSESGPKANIEDRPKKPAVNTGSKVTKSKPTYDAATIPNTSDEEEESLPKITKVGPPKKARRIVKAVAPPEEEEKAELEDASQKMEAVAQRRGHRRRPAAGVRSTKVHDNNDDELSSFEESDSGKEMGDESDRASRDKEEEAEQSEPEDDLAKLANNSRALLEKLDAEDAKWAQDDAEDALAIKGLMSDDPPTAHSSRRRSSSSRPTPSHDKRRNPATSPSPLSRKRPTEGSSGDEDSRTKQNSPPSKKAKPSNTSPAATGKSKAKEIASRKLAAKQREEEREEQVREEREQQRREKHEQQKREERRKERERQLRELERARMLLEQAEAEDQVRPEQRRQPEKKRVTMEKGKERGQGQDRNREEKERAKHGAKSISEMNKTNESFPKKRSRPDEDIVWVENVGNEPSSSKRTPKRKRNNEATGEGSELSEVDADSELDCTEDTITPVLHKEGRIRLTDQHGRIQRVCTAAIKELLTNICIKNAFPDGMEKSSDFAKSALITAAKSLKYEDIRKKLRSDEDYGSKLASIPAQRVSNLRSKAKKAADPLVSTVFNLEDGDADKVRWLHDGLRYIYPHNYENNTVDGEKAYNHSIFYQVLRSAFFNKPRSFGFKIADRFESSHPEKPDEKEIPSALLALAATAVFASIEDHRTSRSEVGDFKGNLFIDVYWSNMDILSEVKSDNIGAYHRLMHDLYCKLMGTSATSVRKSARTFLNTKNMAQ